MVLVTTEFSYLFLDIHLQNAFSAFGVQFISSFQLAQRTGGALCCPERCEQNFRCTLLHFCPVQSFPSPNTLRGKVGVFFPLTLYQVTLTVGGLYLYLYLLY